MAQRNRNKASVTNASFELLYYNPDLEAAITKYVLADEINRHQMDCVEPADGFHPSQVLQMLLAEQIWNWLDTEHPTVLPQSELRCYYDSCSLLLHVRTAVLLMNAGALLAVNPHNADIVRKFGDQGGY